MKVRLLSYTKDPEQVVASAIRQCYSAIGAAELKKKLDSETRKRLINQVMASGHTSTLEHAQFSFAVEGISRVTEVQLVRHRIGTAYSVQSGRYVKRGEAKYTIPPKVRENKEIYKEYKKYLANCNHFYNQLLEAGVAVEDARFVQPQSLQTKLVVSMNARALLHFFNLRCCRRAQWEIQALANEMLRLVKKVAPTIFAQAGATCVSDKICFEGKMSCGRWEKIPGAILKSGGRMGKFIVFEGIGGCGKDTQVKLVQRYLKKKNKQVLVTREHTRNTPPGALIERIIKKRTAAINPIALQLLYIVDRKNHYEKVIKPALERGEVVIGNRFYPTTAAYCPKIWRKTLLELNQKVVGRPDLVLIIDVDPKAAINRVEKRGGADMFDKVEKFKKFRQGYRWYANNSGDKVKWIDGSGSKEEVFERIVKIIGL